MSNTQVTLSSLVQQENVMNRLKEVLGKKAAAFATSVVQIQGQNDMLKKCDPKSILNAAMVSATLDLPINNQIGHTYIVPYGANAQFQIGYKGWIQLAQRTGQYLKLNVTEVYENQFKSWNAMTEELDANFSVSGSGKIVGYVSYFKLVSGFEKICYWPMEKVLAHAKRHSKTFNNGPWKTDFDKMAMKTVIKDMLNKWGPVSVEMQLAIKTDQAVINDEQAEDVTYVDANTPAAEEVKPEITGDPNQRILRLIQSAKTLKSFNQILSTVPLAQKEFFSEEIEIIRESLQGTEEE